MHIHLITIGTKMPGWVDAGYHEYAKRMPPETALNLVEIPAEKRTKQVDIERLMQKEGEKMLAAIKPGYTVVALDRQGQSWDTETLAQKLEFWRGAGNDIALLIGGPEGLAPACLAKATTRWSLSPLTLPHPLVRIVVAEQLYRAYSILQNHPYHR